MEDAQLVQAFLAGDAQAFNTLVKQWQNRIHYFAYRYFANKQDAADITQKTFIKAYQKINTLSEPAKFGPWLYRIAKNLCLDEVRRNNSRKLTSIESIDAATKDNHLAKGSELESEITKELIQKALLELPEEQRLVIIMKEYEGLTFIEIAEILEIPLSTVKSRLYYGLRRLKIIFESWNIKKEDFKYD